jgi:mannobiose 2-epimerase
MIRILIFLTTFWTVTGFASAQGSAQETKNDQAVTADQCRALLEESIIDFYHPNCIDLENFGFLESLDDEGNFTSGDKFLALQARQIWFFSHLAVNNVRRQNSSAAAEQGYSFLNRHFRDSKSGGYILITAGDGAAKDDRKHVYPMSFVIYSLVELHRITDNQQPLDDALKLFHELETNCYDKENGGYQELFTNDWQLIDDPEQWGVVSTAGIKTYNSHLHLMEAFTELYRETKHELVGRRLEELISINTTTVRHPKFGCNVDGWTPDWKMLETEKNLRASYGHDLECIWLVLEANDALGRSPTLFKSWAIELCEQSIKYGLDSTHGGFFSGGPFGKPADDKAKVWWVQSEAMVAMLTMEKLTGDKKYRELFEETFRFVKEHHVAKEGGWWANLNEDGSVGDSKMRASMWKGAYHDGRALMRCEKLLRELE